MPAPSARSATRAVSVLDYFTTNPGRAFTLSELSAAVGASPSSLSSVLQALLDKGYLVRHPRHKTYELGPALVAVGHAAIARHPVVDLARPELARLAAEIDSECIGSVVLGEDLLILAVEGRATQRTRGLTVGVRIPFMPPFGEIWLAYGGPGEIERWWERGSRHPDGVLGTPDADSVARLRAALDEVRSRGYAVVLRNALLTAFGEAITLHNHRPVADGLRERVQELAEAIGTHYELLDSHPEETYEVEMIIAPVFGPDGAVVFAISLVCHGTWTGAEIGRIADRVVDTGLGLTRAIGGRVPSADEQRTAS
ncbi:IclR family transcriptional regulator [Pseudonocardia pini]|uniref:IclR family transcriptional regulator n=1 Tax=Pseudonocardia pini TaxID=2758030 RepID=UPI0015F012FA|nr:helix-turn-helix domain-containing protein [Pseudonocardia pini]